MVLRAISPLALHPDQGEMSACYPPPWHGCDWRFMAVVVYFVLHGFDLL